MKLRLRCLIGRNNLQKLNTIDVHGLKPEEALLKTEQAFRDLLSKGQSTLNVIVGRGLHSKNGIPVVKNYIMDQMQKYVLISSLFLRFCGCSPTPRRSIPCRVDPFNAGILILTMSPSTDDQ